MAGLIRFRADDSLEQCLIERSSPDLSLHLVAKRDLTRYYGLLERADLKPLSPDDLRLLRSCLDRLDSLPWRLYSAPCEVKRVLGGMGALEIAALIDHLEMKGQENE